jgi:hypothetical protein
LNGLLPLILKIDLLIDSFSFGNYVRLQPTFIDLGRNSKKDTERGFAQEWTRVVLKRRSDSLISIE